MPYSCTQPWKLQVPAAKGQQWCVGDLLSSQKDKPSCVSWPSTCPNCSASPAISPPAVSAPWSGLLRSCWNKGCQTNEPYRENVQNWKRNKEIKKQNKQNQLFLVCTGNNLRESSGTFAHCSKLQKKNQEDEGDLSLLFTNDSVHYRDDRSCHVHTTSCPSQLWQTL